MHRIFHLRRIAGETQARGQSLVELAFMFPFLLLILSGALDLGRVYYAYITITNAAREGARYGASHPEDLSGIALKAMNEASGSGFQLSQSDVTWSVPNPPSPGDTLAVTVKKQFQLITTAIVGAGQIQLQSTVQMAVLTAGP
jgi:Flp pilus assembly protein TadG